MSMARHVFCNGCKCSIRSSEEKYIKINHQLQFHHKTFFVLQHRVGKCSTFRERVILPKDIDVVLVRCNTTPGAGLIKRKVQQVYENVHTILRPEKVEERLNISEANATRKLSVLLLGIDNVSRLNFLRSLPKTSKYVQEKGWITMKGYNKIGENTFPNLMAVLTGNTPVASYDKCKPTKLYGLDNCSMIWYAYRNNGYVTSYAEDAVEISTFNFLKVSL